MKIKKAGNVVLAPQKNQNINITTRGKRTISLSPFERSWNKALLPFKNTSIYICPPPQIKPKTTASINPAPQVIVLKKGGLDAILDSIKSAKKNINIKCYIFTDTNRGSIVQELKKAAKRGVKIRVMIEEKPFYWEPDEVNPSNSVIEQLKRKICNELKDCAEIEFKWSNPSITDSRFVTHEKSISIDGDKAFILTGNLSNTTFTTNLDIGAILLKNPEVVGEIERLYNSDWDRINYDGPKNTSLIISPVNSRERILNLIKQAKSSIHIMQQGLTDNEILQALAKKQEEGVKVKVILANPSIVQNNLPSAVYLKSRGIEVSYLEKPYLHAKAVSIDTEDSEAANNVSFIGSQNFSSAAIGMKNKDGSSFRGNRELGIIFDDQPCEVDRIFQESAQTAQKFLSQHIFTESGVLLSAINRAASTANKSILCQTNVFTNDRLANILCKAAESGVEVKVMMPKNPFSDWDPAFDGNIKTAEVLNQHNVKVKWTEGAFKNIGGTTITFDSNQLIISPDNLTPSAVLRNKFLGIIDTEPADVEYLRKRLEIDWNKISKMETPSSSNAKIIAPEERKEKILNLIKSAGKKILLETRELSDFDIVRELEKKAKSSIEVKIILEDNNFNQDNDKKTIERLEKAGAKVELLSHHRLINTFIGIDENSFLLSGGNLFFRDFQETNTYGIIAEEEKNISMAAQAYDIDFLTASIDQVEKEAYLEKREIILPFDEPILDVLFDRAKYGVKVKIRAYQYGSLGYKIKKINDKLKDLSKLNPDDEKDRKKIVDFYDMKYHPEDALKSHKKLIEALNNLKPNENLVSLKKKNWHHIEEEYILADDKKVMLPQTKLFKGKPVEQFVDYTDSLEAQMPSGD